jgi:hypothetical protein
MPVICIISNNNSTELMFRKTLLFKNLPVCKRLQTLIVDYKYLITDYCLKVSLPLNQQFRSGVQNSNNY